ncbi:MAG: radical SAM protein [Deltaproteobacteria bacterium]|nr:radical SAM protein [Deltaproteobacteria bacterium]
MRQLSPTTQAALVKVVGRAIQAREAHDGRPFIMAHHITNHCMCNCASCLWRDNTTEDVPLDELKTLYSAAKAEGFVAAAFTGGEPFLRKDLGEIVRFVKQEAELSILVFTTGWFLEKRMDEVLPHIDMLSVSVDSAKAERHDELRGRKGLFDRLVHGVRLAKERYPNVSIQLNCCVQKGIAEEIDDLIALAKDLGVQISFDVITEARNSENGNAAETDVGLPLEELKTVAAILLAHKRAGEPILNSERYFEYFVNGRLGYNCHLPKLAMYVDGKGFAEYCLNLDQPLGNVRTTPLKEIMAQPRFKQLRVDCEQCSSCNSPTMVDLSHLWENPSLAFQAGGIAIT